ncbi:MAG: GNAT family N-acetyltransferase [Bacteroidales bacterium]
MDIRLLSDTSSGQLFQAFREAFMDYEMQLDHHELDNMLKRRGFDPELSFGAFDRDRLVAFTFNGIGSFKGKKTAYDTGTGTVKEYRGRGLAGKIFQYSIPWLRKAGIRQYLLEVLQHNESAVR